MRWPENRIKDAILDTDRAIRQRAVRYFSKSCRADTSVMPLVIRAVETFGRRGAAPLIGLAQDLPQTEETIDWMIGELRAEPHGLAEDYSFHLCRVLVAADPALLLPRESDILDAPRFLQDLRASFSERLTMLSWDEATCWGALENFCEQSQGKNDIRDVNLAHGHRIVEALARYGDQSAPKVQGFLEQTADDDPHGPLVWWEPLVVRLAGQAQLESAIPQIVAKLVGDGGDLLNEECAEALTRIGTPAVLRAIADAFPEAPCHFRLYATGPLENIHSDLAVEISLKLLRQEKDSGIRVNLATALLGQFASEGLEEARKLLAEPLPDFERRGLRSYLLQTCAMTGDRIPEYEKWSAIEQTEREEHRKQVDALADDPQGLLLFALEQLAGTQATGIPRTPLTPRAASRHGARSRPAGQQRVGRNEPCPCGSGKKFKVCCLRRQA